MFKHILLPIDGSESSVRAVEKGTALAKALDAKVTLMTALEQYPVGFLGSIYRTDDNPMRQAARDAAAHWLNAAQVIVDAFGIQADQLILEERSVCQSILAAAEKSGADLIVMGSHGAGVIEKLLVGSQTQRVLAHSNIPVLVLK